MENATKALLIAAAVLIAIIIISLVLGIVRQGQESMRSVDMSEMEIEAHNSKFKAFESSNASASEVNSLLNTVLSHNQNAEDGATIEVTGNANASVNISEGTINKVQATNRYSITCVMEKGLVTSITINTKN